MTDIVCVNLPKFEPNAIPSALSILKGIANSHNLKTKIIDFNLDWVDACYKNSIDWRLSLSGIHYIYGPKDEFKQFINGIIKDWADRIIDINPKIFAISIFSYFGQYFAKELSKLVKEKLPNTYIVIGGSGISSALHEKALFGEYMVKHRLVNEFITGTAESSWLKVLNQQFNLNLLSINDTFLNIDYINDYSDFEYHRYLKYTNEKSYSRNSILVTYSTSEGCVRKCDFCEIHRYWKFRQRNADQVKKNLEPLLKLVNDCHIEFTDSLVNGSLSEFDEILNVLIDIKEKYPKFTWSGQYIIRNHKNYPETFYKKISQSGGCRLQVGIETGSDELRFKMDKHFTNNDLDYTLKMFQKYNITCTFLLFIGHPEEFIDDFKKTIEMFDKYKNYANNLIISVQLNYVMSIHKNTPLYDKADQLGLRLTADPGLWSCKSNPTLTVKERMRRRLLLEEHVTNLGYTLAHDNYITLNEYALNYSKYKYAIEIIDRD